MEVYCRTFTLGEADGGRDFVEVSRSRFERFLGKLSSLTQSCTLVKEPLRKVLGKALLTYTELYTVLTEVKAIINARPLTFVGDDIRDQEEPITPAHLATGRSLRSLPTPTDIPDDDAGLLKCYLYRQRLVSHFWRRWQNEYLQQLSIHPKWNQEQPPVKIGDIVLISEDKTP